MTEKSEPLLQLNAMLMTNNSHQWQSTESPMAKNCHQQQRTVTNGKEQLPTAKSSYQRQRTVTNGNTSVKEQSLFDTTTTTKTAPVEKNRESHTFVERTIPIARNGEWLTINDQGQGVTTRNGKEQRELRCLCRKPMTLIAKINEWFLV